MTLITLSYSYEVTEPQMYRVGDIVEVQMSFVVVPLKSQHFKMLSVLHSIALIDSSFTQVFTSNNSMHALLIEVNRMPWRNIYWGPLPLRQCSQLWNEGLGMKIWWCKRKHILRWMSCRFWHRSSWKKIFLCPLLWVGKKTMDLH